MRGFAAKPNLPTYEEVYGLRGAAVAVYPMYKGLARLVGMDVVGNATNLDEQAAIVKEHWDDYDFFFVHFKYTDIPVKMATSKKTARTEDFDAFIPKILELDPTVVIVTGDHDTLANAFQSQLAPSPDVDHPADCCRYDNATEFNRIICSSRWIGPI